MDPRTVQALIDGALDSMRKSRNAFIVVLVLSAVHMVASYNLYFSWLRTVANLTNLSPDTAIQANQQHLLRWWVDSTFVSVPLLGIRIHAADASFAGAGIIALFMLGTLFAMRRQNHTVGQTVRRVNALGNIEYMRWAYYSITSELVFTPMSANDDPISTLEDPNADQLPDRIFGIRALIGATFFLPGAAILFSFCADILSIAWLPSPFRDNHLTVWGALGTNPYAIARAGAMLATALFLALFCLYWGHRCRRYQLANHAVMKSLAARIDHLDNTRTTPDQVPPLDTH